MADHWDVFIAYSSQDRTQAQDLYRVLTETRRVRVFLDKKRLEPGDRWASRLKQALSRSRVIAVLVSRHSDKSWYQQEEIAIAIDLARDRNSAFTIVPVILRGARRQDIPYGLNSLNHLEESDLSLSGIGKELLRLLQKSNGRGGTEKLGRAVGIFDDLWSRAEPVITGREARTPERYRRRFVVEGNDLVSRDHGQELQRVTRNQLNKRLSPEQREYIEDLERSMEVNRALWKKAYPRRAISKSDRKAVERAVAAMAEDLDGVLTCLERAQLWLDDHYLGVRSILQGARA